MEISQWMVQVRKGVAELVVMSLLADTPMSGAELMDKIRSTPDIGLSEGAIYPLLHRLSKEGLLESALEKSLSGGPPRKVYTLTAMGEEKHAQIMAQWLKFQRALETIVVRS